MTTKKTELATIEGGKNALDTVTEDDWRVLREAIYPSAQSDESIKLALSYCKARNLDPFKRPVHIVPVWDKEARKLVDTIWPGISELRTTAARTSVYAGKDEPEFGPDVEMNLGTQNVTFPEWCKITVYRIVHGHRVGFTGVVFWQEAYASLKDGTPNAMWMKRKRGQIAKCAEAEALRAAFPEEIGGDLSAEEMSGQTINDAAGTSADGVFDARASDEGERPQRVVDAESEDVTPAPDAPTLMERATSVAWDGTEALRAWWNDELSAAEKLELEPEKTALRNIAAGADAQTAEQADSFDKDSEPGTETKPDGDQGKTLV